MKREQEEQLYTSFNETSRQESNQQLTLAENTNSLQQISQQCQFLTYQSTHIRLIRSEVIPQNLFFDSIDFVNTADSTLENDRSTMRRNNGREEILEKLQQLQNSTNTRMISFKREFEELKKETKNLHQKTLIMGEKFDKFQKETNGQFQQIRKIVLSSIESEDYFLLLDELFTQKISDIEQLYTIGEELGSGSFGDVFLIKQKKTGLQYALKRISSSKLLSQTDLPKRLYNQVTIQKSITNEYVIKINNIFRDEQYYYLIMQAFKQGSLEKNIQNIQLKQIAPLLIQILRGLVHLHNYNIIHRDIKHQNILVHKGLIKICDFGQSIKLSKSQQYRSTYRGTVPFMAPELIQNKRYSKKIDVWSFGIVAFQLVYKSHPFGFDDRKPMQYQHNENWKLEFPENISIGENFKIFLQGALQKNEQDRWSSLKLLNFISLHKNKLFNF